ncbi:TPA: phenylalanine--tRNA ligase subunit beta [Candidatus Woesearchaeota archaeon]|nr:phenylalanine--tRNA ligase subunit beta [Candidatus Woesearchaeota archaeon]
MPSVKLNKRVFNRLVGRELSDDELRERIPMLGTDLDSVEGDEIDVEVFPNRPDMLSEQGFARAFSAFIGEKIGLRRYKVTPSGSKVTIEASVSDIRPFTACAIMKKLEFNDERIREIIQIQEKLHVTFGRNRKKLAIGIYPLEKIKLPIRYFAEDPSKVSFQPLEFPRTLTGLQILSQHPTGREYGHLLEGKDKFPFFADADNNILSMPPVINSHRTGKVAETTKEVFIECSGFDFNTCRICLNIIVTALADMGGEIYSMELEFPDGKKVTPDLEPRRLKLDVPFINRWIGLSLSETQMVDLLKRMGYGFDTGFVLVPAYRADILHMVDLAEDVAIAYGYDKLEPEIPHVSTIGEEAPIEIFRRRVAEVLIGLGLWETCSYNLTSNDDQNVKMKTELPLVELDSCVNTDYNVLRTWMLPSMLSILKLNKVHEYPQNIFEIGSCFKIDASQETGVCEFLRLAVALCGPDSDYTKAKQAFQCLMDALDLEVRFEPADHPSFIPGRCARAFINEKSIAYIGELSPDVLDSWELKMPVSGFELNITDVFGLLKKRM